MQQFSSLLSWHLLTAQHVSGVFPPLIRSSMTAVAASGFTVISWWQSCCVRGRASRPHVPVYYPDIYLQLNMFRAFSRPSSGAQWLQWQPLVLLSYRGDSRAVFVVGPAGHMFQFIILTFIYSSTCFGRFPLVKPEAATAVIELLMMGGKTPETRWAVNKCQDNKLENCCIWLVIYLNCTMMHGLTNLKCIVQIVVELITVLYTMYSTVFPWTDLRNYRAWTQQLLHTS